MAQSPSPGLFLYLSWWSIFMTYRYPVLVLFVEKTSFHTINLLLHFFPKNQWAIYVWCCFSMLFCSIDVSSC